MAAAPDKLNSIHPSVIDKVDPEYIAFHNAHLLDVVPAELLPWDPKIRSVPTVPGTSDPLEVGEIKDYPMSRTNVRVFTPKGDRPAQGWPVFIWFHGGGWTLGNITSDTSFITRMVTSANCVVVSVDYRLAPENPYPAAVEDAVEALHWVREQGPEQLHINPTQIAVGGSSSGGNLATVLALKAAEQGIPLVFQLLIVPVTDNTASIDDLWAENQHMPWLSPGRMLWFRNNYLPNKADYTKWDASPAFAPSQLVRQLPLTWMGICERDILRDEAIKYGQKLKDHGISVEVKVYKDAPHPIMAMDVLKIGKEMVADAGNVLHRAFSNIK